MYDLITGKVLIRTAFQISNEISTNVNWNYTSSKALFCLQPEIGKKKGCTSVPYTPIRPVDSTVFATIDNRCEVLLVLAQLMQFQASTSISVCFLVNHLTLTKFLTEHVVPPRIHEFWTGGSERPGFFYVSFIIVFASPQKANYGIKVILDSKRKKENVGSLKNSFEMPSLAKVVCVASLPPWHMN